VKKIKDYLHGILTVEGKRLCLCVCVLWNMIGWLMPNIY